MSHEALIERFPWMIELEDLLQETCHDCAVAIGEHHIPGCDAARCRKCGGQHMVCGCDVETDIWSGLMMPNLYYLCLVNDLWCYDAIEINGKEFPITTPEMSRLGLSIQLSDDPLVEHGDSLREIAGEEVTVINRRTKWHIPCKKGDPGAHADLNSASMLNAQRCQDDSIEADTQFEQVGLWV
jgi:hypothetical protein